MEVIGIICEYNPFHSGHKYHIDKIKEKYKDSIIVAAVSTTFTERGDISIINKWDKTKIALNNNIDIVLEIPTAYSCQSADKFAHAAVKALNNLNVTKIIFGSETDDINKLKQIAEIQINNKDFENKVKKYVNEGNNYPTSLSKALKESKIEITNNPNDLLGISYIKEIIKNNYNIKPISIKRSNNFHGKNKGKILSATEIREKIKNKKRIKKYINYNEKIIYKNINYFNLLKYEIINNKENLINIEGIDEGLEKRILKNINNSNTLEELIKNIKTKRYTYNRINRTLTHILIGLTKQIANEEINYTRVLGFNEKGKKYLNKIKKEEKELKIITNYKEINSNLLNYEKKVSEIYSLITNDKNLIKQEIEKPIYINK